MLAVTRDAETQLEETGQLLYINVDQLVRCLALVALNWRLGFPGFATGPDPGGWVSWPRWRR